MVIQPMFYYSKVNIFFYYFKNASNFQQNINFIYTVKKTLTAADTY